MHFARLIVSSALVALVMCASSPASACRIGGDQILFEEEPSPENLPDIKIVRVHFTNSGPHVEKLRGREAPTTMHSLIGVASVAGAQADHRRKYIPVYALVTSCMHGFFGNSVPEWKGEYFLIGRFGENVDGPYFLAGGNWNGRWHD